MINYVKRLNSTGKMKYKERRKDDECQENVRKRVRGSEVNWFQGLIYRATSRHPHTSKGMQT